MIRVTKTNRNIVTKTEKEQILDSFDFQKKRAAFSLTDKEFEYLTFSGLVTKDLIATHSTNRKQSPSEFNPFGASSQQPAGSM